jgi:flagellin FlaB
MRNIFKILKKKDVGSIGIGAMIVFIAMVLVAGIAASVLIQTSTKLEAQALSTGRETTQEVAGGIAIVDVEGHVATEIDGLAITIRPRSGSPDIDLNESVIILSDSSKKVLLAYDYTDTNHFNSSVDASDGRVFGFKFDDLTYEEFGILVLEDADSSCQRYTPVINYGDKVMLFVDSEACFDAGGDGIATRTDVFGYIYPEYGSPGVIGFRTPASYSDTVYDLQ